jgi:hypothetical protein
VQILHNVSPLRVIMHELPALSAAGNDLRHGFAQSVRPGVAQKLFASDERSASARDQPKEVKAWDQSEERPTERLPQSFHHLPADHYIAAS